MSLVSGPEALLWRLEALETHVERQHATPHKPLTGTMSETEEPSLPLRQNDMELVIEKVSTDHGFDIRGYKRGTLYRRIKKRMSDVRCPTVEDYLVRLESDPCEFPQLVNTILINVTEFFRDRDAWEYLKESGLKALVRSKAPGEPIRAWSVGCATGEEAYSLAICLAEVMAGQEGRPFKIYATDKDEGALSVARTGIYNAGNQRNLPPERLERFFAPLPGGHYKVCREVRSPVIFGHHNALEHAPISRLDILVCRNLLIYFDSEAQQRLLKRFHYALRDGGLLFLGKAETLKSRSSLFRVVEPRYRIFQRTSVAGV